MSIKKMVYADYKEAVALSSAHHDLKTSLKVHERAPKFLDKVAEEVEKVARSQPRLLDRQTIKTLVYDLTGFFLKGIEKQYREREESEIQKHVEKAKQDKEKQFKKATKELDETGKTSIDGIEVIEDGWTRS
jgi:hypothetical protein